MLTKQAVLNKLYDVPDPELGISIVDLGLIYEVTVKKEGIVDILMTLTTMGCPLFGVIESDMSKAVESLEEVKKVNIELTFEPPWTPDKMSDDAKMQMGLD
jgi:metal-sulfur cluster biosynthetic enzyme